MSENNDYAKLIELLEKERDALNVAIAMIRAKSGLPAPSSELITNASTDKPDAGSLPLPTEIRNDTFFNLSIPAAVKKYLMISKRPKSAVEIVDALKRGGMLTKAVNFYNNVYNTMLREKTTFTKINEKEWGLVEWYPNRPKPAQVQKSKPKHKTKKKMTKPAETTDATKKTKPTQP